MEKTEKNDVGEKINALRTFLGYSNKSFGDKIGYSSTHVIKIEKGNALAREELLDTICQVFNVNPKFFTTEMKVEEAIMKEENDGLTVSSRLKKLREEQKLTQTELAERSGATQPVISSIESGREKMNLKQAKKLAGALGVGTEYLLTGNLKTRDYPVNDEMIAWLWEHKEERRAIWEKMKG